jgi:two-component system, OmpR family, alkaline phosphatase synthesis response regulator PhoP
MIYCLEDDEDIRELELYTLNSMKFEAEGFANAQDFFAAIYKKLPELVVLDVMLPDRSGVDVLKQLRADPRTSSIPVIMATARSGEFEKISALDFGADDYLTKPFSIMELVARIRAILRRSSQFTKEKKDVITFGPITIDEEKHSVICDDNKLDLSIKEFDLLSLLIKHPGRVYSRDELLNRIWGIDYDGENRTVDVHIRLLRVKLSNQENLIQTVRGIGYKADL